MSAEPRAAGSIAGSKRRRLRAALGASLLVHATAVVVLLRVARDQPRPQSAAPRPPIEVSLREIVRPAAAPLPERTPPPPRARPERVRPAAPPGRAPPGPIAASPPPRAPSPAAAPTPPINLSFDALAGAAQRRAAASGSDPSLEAVLTPPPSGGPSGGRRSIDELRAESDRQSAAESNVRQGRAPPVLYDYLRDARAHLEGQATRLAEALPLGPGQTAKGWARGYLGRVDEVNRRAARDLPETPDDDFGHRPDVLGGYREAERQAETGAEQRTAEVCLGVAPGHPVVVTLRRSSGHAALDRLAVQSFEIARDERPIDPDTKPGLACYTVRIAAFRMPPLPSFGVGIKNGKPDLIYPLKRITKVTVELRSLDHGDRPASSSLLGAP